MKIAFWNINHVNYTPRKIQNESQVTGLELEFLRQDQYALPYDKKELEIPYDLYRSVN